MSLDIRLRQGLEAIAATVARGHPQTTPVTILSDGADGPRAVGEAASLGLTRHVLDWFRAT